MADLFEQRTIVAVKVDRDFSGDKRGATKIPERRALRDLIFDRCCSIDGWQRTLNQHIEAVAHQAAMDCVS